MAAMQAQRPETFAGRMASLMPGCIVFCGHRSTNISLLMRSLVEHILDRPQAAADAESILAYVHLPAPDMLWLSMMDGRVNDERIRFSISGVEDDPLELNAMLKMRLASQKRPADHMIVVLDHVTLNYVNTYMINFMMRHAYDYNITLLIHSSTAPRMPISTDEKSPKMRMRMDDLATAAVIAWDISPAARGDIWETFGASFGAREEFEKHYAKLTNAGENGGGAMIMEYHGSKATAYGCNIPPGILVPSQRQ